MKEQQDEPAEQGVNRRKMLRRASAVIAGGAAVSVAGAVAATPAYAADGSPVIQGADNNGTNPTGVSVSDKTRPTVALENTGADTVNGLIASGPSLQLKPNGNLISPNAPVGSVSAATDSNLWLSGGPTFGPQFVYSSLNSNMLVPIQPQRVIDSRDPALRRRVATPNSFDAQGRLVARKEIVIDLADFADGATAVFGNVTAVNASADGFAQVYPFGTPRPTSFSNLNFTDKLLALSNSFVTGVGFFVDANNQFHDAITVYVHVSTHLIIDIVAFQAFGWGAVNQAIWPTAATTASPAGPHNGVAAQAKGATRKYRYKKY
jgi:hypothetical protein